MCLCLGRLGAPRDASGRAGGPGFTAGSLFVFAHARVLCTFRRIVHHVMSLFGCWNEVAHRSVFRPATPYQSVSENVAHYVCLDSALRFARIQLQ